MVLPIEVTFFVVSILLVFILVFQRLNIAFVIGLAMTLFSIPIFGLRIVEIVKESFDWILLNTIASLVLAMFLADLYRSTGVGYRMASSLESLSPRIAAVSVPAVIGLLPMPAGAYVSATIIDPLYTKCSLELHEKTFLNYWFRHVWVTVWPLYQGIILASAIVGMSFSEIAYRNWPIFLSAVLGGLFMSRRIFQKLSNNCVGVRGSRDYRGLVHLWPFIVIAVTSLAIDIPLSLSLAITIALFIAIYKPSLKTIAKSLRYSLDPTINILVIESMIFSKAIEKSGLANQLMQYLSPYIDIAVFSIPFLMVVATGFEFTYVTLAFPSILPLLKDYRITIAFLGGFAGAMLSPSHACFVLSAKFFKSSLGSVYRKHLIQTTAFTILIGIAITLLIFKFA